MSQERIVTENDTAHYSVFVICMGQMYASTGKIVLWVMKVSIVFTERQPELQLVFTRHPLLH